MIPPGFIGQAFASWVSKAILHTGHAIHMDVEILVTSHVPVYGYGKSHGYTKLIRLVSLPLPLASYDAYLYSSSQVVDEMKLGRKLMMPSEESLGKIVQLTLRWHCRLSREYFFNVWQNINVHIGKSIFLFCSYHLCITHISTFSLQTYLHTQP